MSALAVLLIGAARSQFFPTREALTGLGMALFFYRVDHRNIILSVDVVLAHG